MSAARLVNVRPMVMTSLNGWGHTLADRLDELGHQLAALGPVGFAVGGDHPLVDAPGGLDLDMLVAGEERFEPLLLFVCEQIGAGV